MEMRQTNEITSYLPNEEIGVGAQPSGISNFKDYPCPWLLLYKEYFQWLWMYV